MKFLTLGALAVALLVLAPLAAHLLRRRKAEERAFPPARLVPASPPVARRRNMLEDRALFAIRALAVLALAVLGATPFLHCSRLAVGRKGGASVGMAIVLDDSMSMRAPLSGGIARPGGATRFDRALAAARELAAGAHTGDAVAIVLAGAPARVALASTTNMAAVAAALDSLEPSDRATDLDGALALGRELVKGLVQPDKRIVVLSDLADGSPDGPPIGGGSEGDIQTWVPLDELRAAGADCAVTRADRAGSKVHARIVCTPAAPAAEGAPAGAFASAGRTVELRADALVIARAPLAAAARVEDVSFDVPPDAIAALHVALTGGDAIAEDDDAPVVTAGGSLSVASVVDPATTRVATGGAPPLEQAFAALALDASVHPLPSVPEHEADLAAYAALIVDDPPGFTPEMRRTLAAWIERGGVLLLTLGPRAAAAPLGAGFDPLVPGIVRWVADGAVRGVDPASAPTFGSAAAGLADVAPRGRAVIDAAASEGAEVLARWKDEAPFLLRRPLARGAVLVLTLPLSTDESDVVLRPAFLSLLERFVSVARARGGARRIEVGEAWTFDGYGAVSVRRAPTRGAPASRIEVTATDGHLRASPSRAGLYELDLGGERSARVAGVPEREIDFRPRRVLEGARATALGGVAESIDASPYVALALLGLLASELLLRAIASRRDEASAAR